MKFVRKVALINASHGSFIDILDSESKDNLQRIAVNYIPSTESAGSLLYSFSESDE